MQHPRPTLVPELNELLRELSERAAEILGGNFVGAYLQGSFAVGDADMQSDCDFLIPVHGPITPDQEAGLRALHDEIPTRPGHWTHHLEGSDPDKDQLRTLEGLGRPWLYIDHGWRAMQWSTHRNTEVVRWSLRECGVTLTGPDPKELVDPVGPDVLAASMRELARRFLPDLGPGGPPPRPGPACAAAPGQRRADPGVARPRPPPGRRRARRLLSGLPEVLSVTVGEPG